MSDFCKIVSLIVLFLFNSLHVILQRAWTHGQVGLDIEEVLSRIASGLHLIGKPSRAFVEYLGHHIFFGGSVHLSSVVV